MEFVNIDPSWTAEGIAAKRKYAGHMYYKYKPEESWTRPGLCAFGSVNGGAIFVHSAVSMGEQFSKLAMCLLCALQRSSSSQRFLL